MSARSSIGSRRPSPAWRHIFIGVLALGTLAPATLAQTVPTQTYTTHAGFLEDVVPYDTLGFTVINPTIPPIPDPYNPLLLHYPQMIFGPVIVEPPGTNQYAFGFHTTDNNIAAYPGSLQWLEDELIDGNALIPGWGNNTYEQGLRFRFSIDFAQQVTGVGAFFGSLGEVSPCCVRQGAQIDFWDGGSEWIDIVATRGIEQANEEFFGYASSGRAIRAITFYQTGHSFVLDNFVYGLATQTPESRIIRVGGDLAFGGVPVGGISTRTFRVSNDGMSNLTVAGISYPAAFSGAWSGVIAPGGFQDVTVTFAPTAGVAYGQTVIVNGNQTSGTNTIAVSGAGTLPETSAIHVSGNLAFGYVPVGLMAQRPLRVTNVGTGPLTITGISYPAGFTGAWSGVIAPGAFQDVMVTFAPPAVRGFSGTVIVAGSQTTGTNAIPVSGTGSAGPFQFSGDLSFGAVFVGDSATRPLRITNAGTVDASVNLYDPWGVFAAPSSVFVPAASFVDVSVTFAPTATDPWFGLPWGDFRGYDLAATWSYGSASIPMSGTGLTPGTRLIDVYGDLTFGTVLVGNSATRTLHIANKGGEDVTVSGISYPAGFSGAWSGVLAPGEVRNVLVTFIPTAATAYGGAVRVNGDQQNDLVCPLQVTDWGCKLFADATGASGTGAFQATRVLALSGDLAFGAVQVGSDSTRTLRIRNVGTAPLTVTGISYPPGFTGAWAGSIGPGEAHDVAVTFAPPAGLWYGGTVTVTGDQTSGANTLPVSGAGLSRVIALSGDLAFGAVRVGTTATRTLRITNMGTAWLTVTGIRYPLGFSGAWSGWVSPGGFQDVAVTFAPSRVGVYSGVVIVDSNKTSGATTAAAFGSATVANTEDLAVNLGPAFGTWLLQGASWSQIHGLSPDAMVTGDLDGNGADDLVLNFGPGVGVYAWMNHTTWTFLHPWSPSLMVTGDLDHNGHDDIVFVFPGYGVWRWADGSWSNLHGLDATHLAVGNVDGVAGDDLVLDFPGYGLYVFWNSATWTPLHGLHANTIVTADLDGSGVDDVVIDFPGYGLWVYYNHATWAPLHGLSPAHLAAGSIDGTAQADLVIDFGPGVGLWTFRNNTTWAPLHGFSTEGIVLADRDGTGKDEVIIDFGATWGLWQYANDSSWSQLHGLSPDSMVAGRFH